MRQQTKPRQRDMTRVIRAAKAAGMENIRVEVDLNANKIAVMETEPTAGTATAELDSDWQEVK